MVFFLFPFNIAVELVLINIRLHMVQVVGGDSRSMIWVKELGS